MKVTQIEKDKIEIFLSKTDLEENKISIQTILSNPSQTKKLFLSILNIAEEEIGFKTANYDIAIETLSINNSDYIFTITRIKNTNNSRLKISRKKYILQTYKFFDFNTFYEFFKQVHLFPCFKKTFYVFNDNYYFISNDYIKNHKGNFINKLSEYAIQSNLPQDLIKSFGKTINIT